MQCRPRPVARGGAVSLMARLSEQALARAALTYLAEPGDPALGALLEICEPAEVLAAIKADMLPGTGPGCGDSPASRRALERALGRWRVRLPICPARGRSRLPAATASGWSAPATRSGRPGWTTSARPARTRCGCGATPICAWPVRVRSRWWGRGRHGVRRARGRRDRRRPRRARLGDRLGRRIGDETPTARISVSAGGDGVVLKLIQDCLGPDIAE